MVAVDLERVLEIAQSLKEAPHWPPDAYLAALDPHNSPQRIALVAEEAGAVAGFAVAILLPPQAELEMIAVAAESQRRGVARQLFAALAREFVRAQITEVILEVRASNRPALGFYCSLGFQKSGRRLRYYADPIEDAVLMNLRGAE
jgi:ribosomal-protein-alanine N-acetyltransferase